MAKLDNCGQLTDSDTKGSSVGFAGLKVLL